MDHWCPWNDEKVPLMLEGANGSGIHRLAKFRDDDTKEWDIEKLHLVFPQREVDNIQKLRWP